MISKINDIYKCVSDTHGIDIKLVESIGNHVFRELREGMSNLGAGNYLLSSVGSFVLKSGKVETHVRKYLAMRKYMCEKNPKYIDKPISKSAKRLFKVYLDVIIPYKKAKQEISLRQVEFCKKMVESYEKDNN